MIKELVLDTTFSVSFDFASAAEQAVLQQLQAGNYQLLAYKGATGPSQVSAGLPVWFSVPFGNLFDDVVISYTPQYEVYVFNQATIAANTVITMQGHSNPVGLGTALNFNQDGSFTSAGSSPAGTITLNNLRPAGTPDITVGLAGQVTINGQSQFLPFCAFTVTPLGSVEMAPVETVAMMAAQLNLQSGSVQANASAPGCSFTFDSSDSAYQLTVTPDTLAITNMPNTLPVQTLLAGQALGFLNG